MLASVPVNTELAAIKALKAYGAAPAEGVSEGRAKAGGSP